nr:hypothetical protein [Nannocystis sp.]
MNTLGSGADRAADSDAQTYRSPQISASSDRRAITMNARMIARP